jgi:serine/threonine-protein kinase HipA
MMSAVRTDVVVLDVRLHGRTIGTLTRLPDDRNLFAFDSEYVNDRDRPTFSLSFKDSLGGLITQLPPTQTRLAPFFSNLLPEGTLRDYLAKRANVKPQREFFLAAALGQDLPGAVQITSRDSASFADSTETEHEAGDEATQVLHFSLAGVQLKFSAVEKATGGLTVPADGVGGAWIVKLPSQTFAGVPENEFAMMELARQIGIDVPETRLLPVAQIGGIPAGIELLGDTAFAIKRFDRGPKGQLIHIEDFAQVFGVYPERKYERASYRNIARVLWIETGEAGIVEFVRRLVFNALIGNADMHLKNWSLIYPDSRQAQLAPACDYVATIAYLRDDALALNLVDSKKFSSLTLEQFARLATKAGLPEKITLDAATDTVHVFRSAWRDFDNQALSGKTRDAIDKHLSTIPLWRTSVAPSGRG